MDYRRFDDKILLRLNKGEEIVSSIEKLVIAEGINLAMINGIGASDRCEVGFLNRESKKYDINTYEERYEITSLDGNVSRWEEKVSSHLHINMADSDNKLIGGHLQSCIVGETAEIVLTIIEGKIDRKMDKELGINLIEF